MQIYRLRSPLQCSESIYCSDTFDSFNDLVTAGHCIEWLIIFINDQKNRVFGTLVHILIKKVSVPPCIFVKSALSCFAVPQDFLWRDGANMGWVVHPVTCEPKQESRTLHIPSNNTANCCHGLQLSTPLWGHRGSEGRLSLPTVPEGPSVILPTPRTLWRGALWRWPPC